MLEYLLMLFNVTNKLCLIAKGGGLIYVHSKKEKRRIGRLALGKVSKENLSLWLDVGTS